MMPIDNVLSVDTPRNPLAAAVADATAPRAEHAAVEAERALCGSIMLQDNPEEAAGVTAEDFTDPACRAVFTAITAVNKAHRPSHYAEVAQWFEEHPAAAQANRQQLDEMVGAARPGHGDVEDNARIVHRKAVQRRFADAMAGVASSAMQPDADVAALAAAVRRQVEAIEDENTQNRRAYLRGEIQHRYTQQDMREVPDMHPHYAVNNEYGIGLWPVDRVSTVSGLPRSGKSLTLTSMLIDFILGKSVYGLVPPPDGAVLVYSAEDDPKDYMRCIRALAVAKHLTSSEIDTVFERLIMPKVRADSDEFVSVNDRRQPEVTQTIDDLIAEARGQKIALVIGETESRLNGAEENNQGLREFVRAGERIAEALHCAFVVTHHVSQGSTVGLKTLDLSIFDQRGGTSLPSNTRQTASVVNLGSEDDPLPDSDYRTILRRNIYANPPADNERTSVYWTIDSSKSAKPLPMFFTWRRVGNIDVPVMAQPDRLAEDFRGVSAAKLVQLVRKIAEAEKPCPPRTARIPRTVSGQESRGDRLAALTGFQGVD